MTDAQIMAIYARERDNSGIPKPVGPDRKQRRYKTPEELKAEFVQVMSLFGKSEGEAVAAWDKKYG